MHQSFNRGTLKGQGTVEMKEEAVEGIEMVQVPTGMLQRRSRHSRKVTSALPFQHAPP